jgi:pilus assembly protein CpaF
VNSDLALKDRIRSRLLAEVDQVPLDDRSALRDWIDRQLAETAPLLPAARANQLADELVLDVDGFGPLEAVFADPTVTEIMLNRPGVAYVERNGTLERLDLDLDHHQIVRVADRVIAPLGLRLDRASPIVDARLPDGSRLHAVLPPLAPDGPCVTIRRFVRRELTLADFGLDLASASLVESAVASGWNLLVAGGTSAGKTTLLNAAARAIPPDQRVVTIEETAEIDLGNRHLVRLEARPPNAEGAGGVSLRDLVKAALRMRPDRIIVGEVRGGEALDMLQALNTGHDGSLCTVHANGTDAALTRLETLALMAGVPLPVEAVRAQIAAAIDAVVFVARDPAGRRQVEAFAEVVPRSGAGDPRAPLATRDLLGDLSPARDAGDAPRAVAPHPHSRRAGSAR